MMNKNLSGVCYLVLFISTLLFLQMATYFYVFFVVKDSAVQQRSNVKWCRLISATP